jgi:intergrase/recombinase
MSIQVRALNEYKAKEVLKTCPKIIRDYVKALKSSIESSQQTTSKAITKIREQTKEIEELKNELKILKP